MRDFVLLILMIASCATGYILYRGFFKGWTGKLKTFLCLAAATMVAAFVDVTIDETAMQVALQCLIVGICLVTGFGFINAVSEGDDLPESKSLLVAKIFIGAVVSVFIAFFVVTSVIRNYTR